MRFGDALEDRACILASPSRSVVVKRGLPVRDDGGIDLDPALEWMRAHVATQTRGSGEKLGRRGSCKFEPFDRKGGTSDGRHRDEDLVATRRARVSRPWSERVNSNRRFAEVAFRPPTDLAKSADQTPPIIRHAAKLIPPVARR